MICKNVNANLVLSMSYLLHCVQELFCEDNDKREQAIIEFRDHEEKLMKGFAYILNQAEKFHQFKLKKGGRRDGNSNTFPVEARKRAAG